MLSSSRPELPKRTRGNGISCSNSVKRNIKAIPIPSEIIKLLVPAKEKLGIDGEKFNPNVNNWKRFRDSWKGQAGAVKWV